MTPKFWLIVAIVWGGGGYHYDAMGNMTSLALRSRALSFSYQGPTPKLQSVMVGTTTTPVDYDDAGNEAGHYNARNLLDQIESGDLNGPSTLYAYDGRGIRVAETVDYHGIGGMFHNRTRSFIYSPELHLLAQSDWQDTPYVDGMPFSGTEYVWFGNEPAAQAFTDPGITIRYTFTDHLGTPILQTGPNASIVWRAEYEPYGDVYVYRAGNADDAQALRLPGQEANGTNSTSYNIFRWYRSGWGRYTQDDPIAARHESVQFYSYALDNPLSLMDPSGLFEVDPFCKGCNNPLRTKDKSNLFQHIVEETATFCQTQLGYIKNIALRDCMKKSNDVASSSPVDRRSYNYDGLRSCSRARWT